MMRRLSLPVKISSYQGLGGSKAFNCQQEFKISFYSGWVRWSEPERLGWFKLSLNRFWCCSSSLSEGQQITKLVFADHCDDGTLSDFLSC